MTYKVVLHKKVHKFLLSHPELAFQFEEKVLILRNSPFHNNLDIRKLSGEDNKRGLRIGKYRFLYETKQSAIIIFFYKADSRGHMIFVGQVVRKTQGKVSPNMVQEGV